MTSSAPTPQDLGAKLVWHINRDHPDMYMVESLIAQGAALDTVTPLGYTALMVAIYHGHEHVVRLLLQHNVPLEQRDYMGSAPLIDAARWGRENIFKMLLEHNAFVDVQDNQGMTALMWVSLEGREDFVKILLKKKARLDILDKKGKSVFDFAREGEQPGILQQLNRKKEALRRKKIRDEKAKKISAANAQAFYPLDADISVRASGVKIRKRPRPLNV